MKLRHLGGAVAAALLTLSAHAQVPDIAAVAANIPLEHRTRLSGERRALDARYAKLDRQVTRHNAECDSVPDGTAASDRCAQNQERLEADIAGYIAAVEAFNDAVVAASKSARPMGTDPAMVDGGTPKALAAANRKTNLLLDALEAGKGDWLASIRYLTALAQSDPADEAAREALAYLKGLYAGQLGAQNVGDNYYRHGTRAWVRGDYDAAARAFAQAVRQNPDDLDAFRTYAHTVGLRDQGAKCERQITECQPIDLPDRIRVADDVNADVASGLRAKLALNPDDREARAALRFIQGQQAYLDYIDGGPTQAYKPEAAAQIHYTDGLKKVAAGDYQGAERSFKQALALGPEDRRALFASWYAKGRFDRAEGRLSHSPTIRRHDERFGGAADDALWNQYISAGGTPPGPTVAANLKKAYAAAVDAIRDIAGRNPFFGTIGQPE